MALQDHKCNTEGVMEACAQLPENVRSNGVCQGQTPCKEVICPVKAKSQSCHGETAGLTVGHLLRKAVGTVWS